MKVNNSERCETVTVNGVVYNKGCEPKEVTPGPKKRGPKKKAE